MEEGNSDNEEEVETFQTNLEDDIESSNEEEEIQYDDYDSNYGTKK